MIQHQRARYQSRRTWSGSEACEQRVMTPANPQPGNLVRNNDHEPHLSGSLCVTLTDAISSIAVRIIAIARRSPLIAAFLIASHFVIWAGRSTKALTALHKHATPCAPCLVAVNIHPISSVLGELESTRLGLS